MVKWGFCKDLDWHLACYEKCSDSKVARRIAPVTKKIKEKYCNGEQSLEPFVQSVKEFVDKFDEEYEKNDCDGLFFTTVKVAELCPKVEACVFEKSFSAVKGSYNQDVVEFVDALAKMDRAMDVNAFNDFSELPSSCDFLFKPTNHN
ncbi:hypothetical protein AAVH_15296 [Aphelenchoides avenae]|nr:hypothetical protein AAVH_15296 [Aphelenchus avenae]